MKNRYIIGGCSYIAGQITGLRIYLLVILALCACVGTRAQLSLTNGAPSATIDFSNNVLNMPTTVGTNTATSYAGAGFSPNPTNVAGPGRLNSNAWATTGWSDGDLNYAGTNITGDHARGVAAGPTGPSTGGFYAYTGAPGSAANPTFMIQPGGSDFEPGTLTLKLINNGTTIITSINISYNLFVRNDQSRADSFNFSYSSDNFVNSDNLVPSMDYGTPIAPDAAGWVQVGGSPSRIATLATGVYVAPGQVIYLRWTCVTGGGSGSRDEIGLDDINITATYSGPCSQPVTQAVVNSFSGVLSSQMDVNYTRGDGTGGVLVVASTSPTLSSDPVSGISYGFNTNYGNGDPLGGGFVVYNGPGAGINNPTSVTVTGLAPSTTYYFFVFEYGVTVPCYKIPGNSLSQMTAVGSATSPTDYFRSRISGNWSNSNTWESSPDNATWITATLKPSFLAKGILIYLNHTITITTNETAKLLNISAGSTLTYNNAASGGWDLDIAADASDIDFKISGTYIIFGKAPTLGSGATVQVYSGGLVRADANVVSNQSDDFARSLSVFFATGSVFQWNTATSFQTANATYFPNALTTDIATFRVAVNISPVGANSTTSVQGLFEVNGNVTLQNNGTKIFRNGIIGTATLTQSSTGPISIDGATAVIGGVGVINLNAAGTLTIAANSLTTLTSNKTVNTGAMNVDGTLYCAAFVVSGSASFSVPSAGTLGIGSADGITSPVGIGNIQTLGRSFSTSGNYIYNGIISQSTGNGLPSPNTGYVTIANTGVAGNNTVTLFTDLTVVDSLNLENGLFEAGTNQHLRISAGGVVARTGVGGNQGQSAAAGTIWFFAGGAGSGTIKPGAGLSLTNVRISGGVNMGAGNTTIKNSLTISAGGSVNASTAPTYSSTPPSTLIYNTGGGYGIGNEWYDNTFGASPGVPHHVTVTGSTAVTLAGTGFPREMRGDMLINSGSFALTGGFGCDLYIKGNWTRSAGTTFSPNTRAVKFNGSAPQTVTRTGGGTEIFSYMLIDKPANVAVVQAAAPNATTITVTGFGGNSLQLISGDLDLNHQTFNFTSYTSSQNNIGIDGISPANLTRNITSTGGTGIFLVYNSLLVNHYVTVNRINGLNASLLVFGPTVTVKTGAAAAVGGGGGIDFGSNLTTINGTLQLNNYGYVTNLGSGGQGPFYGISSLLMYKSIGLFDRNVEWGNTSGAGYPWHVSVDSSTTLNLNTLANGSANRALAGDLTIFNGSTLVLATNAAANTLTVGRDVFINGTLTLPANFGADIHVVRNWNRAAAGVFIPNDRAVFLDGSGSATITANNTGQLFPYLYIKKNSALDIVSLLDSISISKEFAISTNGKFELNDKNARLISNATGTASFGKMGAGADVTYSSSGRFIVERFIPVGNLAGQHLKSWQHLATPSNGGQTINAAWQEGAAVPNQDPRPGNGTSITSNILPTPAMFDTFSVGGPSMKSYDPLIGLWNGVPNTTGTALFNQKGYLIFVRGDRSVNSFFAPNNVAKATNMRNTGKLFVPGSNPPPSTTVLTGKFASIGNPYASSIDFLSVVTPSIDSVLYLWDPLLYGSYGLGGWQTMSETNLYKPSPGTGGNTIYDPNVAYTKIQSGQAFMVYGSSLGGTVSFTENAKIAGSNLVFRPVNPERPGRKFMRVVLYAANGQVADGNVVAFDPSFSNAFESKDALKIQNQGENFGISSNGKILAVEARSPVLRTDTIQYLFNRLRVQAYQLRFGPENFSNPRLKAFFIDKWLHSRTPVSMDDTTYININITADPASAAADRFMLVFIRKGVVAGIPGEGIVAAGKTSETGKKDAMAAGIRVFPNPVTDGQLHLSFKNKAAGNYKIQLLNAAGQLAYEQSLELETTNAERTMKFGELPAGLYQLLITEPSGAKTARPLIIK